MSMKMNEFWTHFYKQKQINQVPVGTKINSKLFTTVKIIIRQVHKDNVFLKNNIVFIYVKFQVAFERAAAAVLCKKIVIINK